MYVEVLLESFKDSIQYCFIKIQTINICTVYNGGITMWCKYNYAYVTYNYCRIVVDVAIQMSILLIPRKKSCVMGPEMKKKRKRFTSIDR